MPHPASRPPRRVAVIVAVATPAVAALIGLTGCQASSVGSSSPTTVGSPTAAGEPATPPSSSSASGTPGATTLSPPTTVPPTTVAPTTVHPTTVVPPATAPAVATTTPPLSGPPRVGSSGPEVVALQQRLTALGYWLGSADGRFGGTTQQAMFALQKAAGLPRSGVLDAATSAALDAGTKPTPQSTSGHLIEVDLARQLVLIVTDGHLDAALNTSTGGGYVYFDHGSRQVAITPKGHFTTTWQVNGTRVSSLGVLWRPKYFVGGIALHGDSSVPAHPVSHGCVRVSNQAIDWIWATGSDPIGTPVWVY